MPISLYVASGARIGCGAQNMHEVLAGVPYDMLWLYVDLNLRLPKISLLDGSAKYHFWIKPAGVSKFPAPTSNSAKRKNVRGEASYLGCRRDPCIVHPPQREVACTLAGQWSEHYATREKAIDAVVRYCGAGPDTPRAQPAQRNHAAAETPLNLIPYTLYLIPYTLYLIPYILYLIPYTLYLIPYTLNLITYTLYLKPYISYLIPYILYLISHTLYLIPYTLYLIPYSELKTQTEAVQNLKLKPRPLPRCAGRSAQHFRAWSIYGASWRGCGG